ncbi:MAG: DMT family transporter, partial [Alphaproteobacteria bacterium]
PIWAGGLAVIALGERLTKARIIAVAAGFIGVLIIVRPGLAVFNPASLIMLGAAFGFATSVIWVKILVRTDSALTVIFYMTVIQLPMGLIPALFVWVPPVWADLPWLVIVGAGGLSAHYALARALKIADATIVLPIDFLRLPLIALVGFALYGEALDLWVFIGAAIIFGGGYYMVWRESRAARALAASVGPTG